MMIDSEKQEQAAVKCFIGVREFLITSWNSGDNCDRYTHRFLFRCFKKELPNPSLFLKLSKEIKTLFDGSFDPVALSDLFVFLATKKRWEEDAKTALVKYENNLLANSEEDGHGSALSLNILRKKFCKNPSGAALSSQEKEFERVFFTQRSKTEDHQDMVEDFLVKDLVGDLIRECHAHMELLSLSAPAPLQRKKTLG